jgi:hypothetical protein
MTAIFVDSDNRRLRKLDYFCEYARTLTQKRTRGASNFLFKARLVAIITFLGMSSPKK